MLSRRRNRPTLEKLSADCLDVNELRRADVFQGRPVVLRSLFRWPRITKIRASQHLLQLELRNQAIPQEIPVSWTRCRYGGARPWLHCPYCSRRVAKLIRALAGYSCRHCAGNPVYACQSKSTQGRRHFEACKLRLRLGGIASLASPFPERPRGMHEHTYERLRRRARVLESGLSARFRTSPADYPNLIYYLQPPILK